MYYINKIVGWLFSPMGVLFIGLAAGVVVRCRCRKVGNFLIGALLVGFWILGCGITTRLIGVPLEGVEERVEVEESKVKCGRVDAIVLLGGGMGVHEKCGRAEMFGGADRAWHAARLWRRLSRELKCEGEQLNLPITLSGGGVEQSTVPLLEDLGVPREVMKFFPEARNTEEEAKLIAKNGVKRVLLVTSAWHMPRAKSLFERAGLEVVPAPCDYEMHCAAERPIDVGDFFPGADALARNSWAIKEWVARFCYWLKG